MGLLRKTWNGTTFQTKAIRVPKEYRGGGSKWADWKKEYDGKSNVTIYEMVLRSRSNTNIKRKRLSTGWLLLLLGFFSFFLVIVIVLLLLLFFFFC